MKKQPKGNWRAKATFKQSRIHSEKLSSYLVGSEGSSIMKAESPESESRADIEFRKMVSGHGVFPSSPGAIKTGNSNPRRYK